MVPVNACLFPSYTSVNVFALGILTFCVKCKSVTVVSITIFYSNRRTYRLFVVFFSFEKLFYTVIPL